MTIELETHISPELQALADVLTLAAPGLKMHTALAAQIERMLLKRGVKLASTKVTATEEAVLQRAAQAIEDEFCLIYGKRISSSSARRLAARVIEED